MKMASQPGEWNCLQKVNHVPYLRYFHTLGIDLTVYYHNMGGEIDVNMASI